MRKLPLFCWLYHLWHNQMPHNLNCIMLRLSILSSMLFFLSFAHAQMKEKKDDTNKDSLRQVIATGKDSSKVAALYELGTLLAKDSADKAFAYLDQGLALARQHLIYKMQALILQRKGTTKLMHSAFEESIPYFDSSQNVYLKYRPTDPGLVSLYNNYAIAYYMMENNIRALDIYLRGYELCRNDKSIANYPTIVNNIGLIYKKLEQYPEAIYFLQESAAVKRMKNDKLGEANSLFNIGTIYVEQKQIDSAANYLYTAKRLYLELKEDQDAESADLVMADLYYKTGDLNKARLLMEPFVSSNFSKVDKRNLASPMLILAGMSLKSGQPSASLRWLNIIDTIDRSYLSDKELRDMYHLRADAHAASEDYKIALLYADSAVALEQKIHGEKAQRLTQEMLARLQTNEKESRIQLLEAENTIQELQLKNSRRRNQLLVAGAALFAVVALIFWLLSKKILRQKKLIEKTGAVREKAVAMASMIEGQEAERVRIAKDLHDGLGGLLTTIKSHFSKTIPADGDTANSLHHRGNELIDEACVEVRRIAHNMMPHALSLSGLEGALEDLCSNIRSTGLKCKLELANIPQSLPENKSTMVYRVVQELVQNIIRHAAASEIFLQVLGIEEHLHIVVEDNGRGFDVAAATAGKGLGLESIHSRVKYLNGNLQFDSVPGKGTTVTIEIPAK